MIAVQQQFGASLAKGPPERSWQVRIVIGSAAVKPIALCGRRVVSARLAVPFGTG